MVDIGQEEISIKTDKNILDPGRILSDENWQEELFAQETHRAKAIRSSTLHLEAVKAELGERLQIAQSKRERIERAIVTILSKIHDLDKKAPV